MNNLTRTKKCLYIYIYIETVREMKRSEDSYMRKFPPIFLSIFMTSFGLSSNNSESQDGEEYIRKNFKSWRIFSSTIPSRAYKSSYILVQV